MDLNEDFLRKHMQMCIDLALGGLEIAKPYVGAVIVSSDGKVISKGIRRLMSGNLLIHAERDAITKAQYYQRGAILFTTLEPCAPTRNRRRNCFFKSCTELLFEEEIEIVVYGLKDDSMDGESFGYLRNRGVIMVEYDKLNEQIIGNLMPKKVRERYSWAY